MSASLTPTVASVPSAVENATTMLSLIAALSGQPVDINVGSQVRTLAEAIGSVTEEQGISDQARAVQALAYGAMSLFGIGQSQATFATGTTYFATSLPVSGAPVAPQAVPIPSGTLMQTNGGVQFATTAAATLASGVSSVLVGIIATTAGSIGNVAASAITGTPLTSIGYPLYVSNPSATAGGANAGTQSAAMGQFTAKAASLGLSSPVAIANAAIGVLATGTGETVQFSSVYEPWIAAGSGAGSGTAGFTLFVDNGTGSASPSLITAVQSWISGSVALNQSGYRPAGMPYTVSGTTPVYCSAAVSGTLFPGLLSSGSVVSAIASGVQNYFDAITIADNPGSIAQQSQIAARVADAGLGAFSSLTVNLYYSGSGTPVAEVSGAVGTRVILTSVDVNITVGT